MAPILQIRQSHLARTSVLVVGLSACVAGDRAPEVTVEFPHDGDAFPTGATLELRGALWDPDGLHDLDAEWRSDLDGALADGFGVDALGRVSARATLSGGSHTLRLEAVDPDGNVGFAEVVVSIAGFPTARVGAPIDGGTFLVGASLVFEGVVSDPDQRADTLAVAWSWRDVTGGAETPLANDATTSTGGTRATWAGVPLGSFVVTLAVTDGDGHTTSDEIALSTYEGSDEDRDGDGITEADGDCDDDDDGVFPGAPEVCDGVDQGCNGVIDDKDRDVDGHVDARCLLYVGGASRDDCNDDDDAVFGGASEIQDWTDNDCDGEIDENTLVYDDDGDCHCEDDLGVACIDGVDDSCAALAEGDCNDFDANIHPEAADDAEPRTPFVDSNCDGMDGDEAKGVFLAPTSAGGSDAGTCLRASPCATLTRAMQVASASRPHLYVMFGAYTGTIAAFDGLQIHGGYIQGYANRGAYTSVGYETVIQGVGAAPSGAHVAFATVHAVAVDGVRIANITLQGPLATGVKLQRGQSSYVVHAVGSSLTLDTVTLARGTGAVGASGSDGTNSTTSPAPSADPGTAACAASGCTSPGEASGTSPAPARPRRAARLAARAAPAARPGSRGSSATAAPRRAARSGAADRPDRAAPPTPPAPAACPRPARPASSPTAPRAPRATAARGLASSGPATPAAAAESG